MKRKLMIFTMLIAVTVFWLPTAGSSVSAYNNGDGAATGNSQTQTQPGKRKGTVRKKNAHGYRNYGQYRKTQVGNRRSRLVRRYYWENGVRLSRMVRVNY